ncbi:MAG: hypothetical protein LBB75_08320 [Oscillospiraceae bacterium]|jgi:hydrogenase/urease accessory protein HupE|nr:hypothetical protein [Oscillospiraceae bacterium]
MPQILETAMLACFGLSWPLSILRSWRARTAKGKSLLFMVAIAAGYAAGVAAKFAGGPVTYVVAFYAANLVMVCADIALYFRNRRLDRGAAHG